MHKITMITYLSQRKDNWLFRLLSATSSLAFLATLILPPGMAYAQGQPLSVLNLPVAGSMVLPTPGFAPAVIKGLTVHPENPLAFDFIVDTGDSKLSGKALEDETSKLVRYFLATLTTPEENLWVNLSPYEKDRIIPDKFGETEMGRDLLSQDYILKQLMASMMYPEDGLGKEFWNRVYTRAQQEFGTTKIPINTFNKVWIIPDEAVVVEYQGSAFVAKSHLKVMLEEDYLALAKNMDNKDFGIKGAPEEQVKDASTISSKVVKEILIPEIEKEVNQGKNFAQLRQVYHSMILATWYKKNLKETLLSKVYVDKSKIKGVDVEDKAIKQKIYDQYVEAFKKGVYNYIKKDVDPTTKKPIARKYFSGGFTAAGFSSPARMRTFRVKSPAEVRNLSSAIQSGLQSSSPIAQVGVVLGENKVVAENAAQALASPAKHQLEDKIPTDISQTLVEKFVMIIKDISEKTNLSATSTRLRILNRARSRLSNNEMTFEALLDFLDQIRSLAKREEVYQNAHDAIVGLLGEKPLQLTPYNPVSGYGRIVGTEYGPGVEDGQVTEIIQSGWLLQGEYFRKAEVIVADHSLDPHEAGEEYLKNGDLDNAAKMVRILEEKNPSPQTKNFSLRVDRAWREREAAGKSKPAATTAFSSPAGNWSEWTTLQQAGRKTPGLVFYGETEGVIQIRAGAAAALDGKVVRPYPVVAYYQFEPNDVTGQVKVAAYGYADQEMGKAKYFALDKLITFGNDPGNFQAITEDNSLSGDHFEIYIGKKEGDSYPFALRERGSLNGTKVRTAISPSAKKSEAQGRLTGRARLGTEPREGGELNGQATAGRVRAQAGGFEFDFVMEESKPGQIEVTITKDGKKVREPIFIPLGTIVVLGRASDTLNSTVANIESSSKKTPVHVIDMTKEDQDSKVSRVHFALQIQKTHEGVYVLDVEDLKSTNNTKVFWEGLFSVEIAENNWDFLRKPPEWGMFFTQTEEGSIASDGILAGFQLIYTAQGVITGVVGVNDRISRGEESVIVNVTNRGQLIIAGLEKLPPLLKAAVQKYNQSMASYSEEIVDANKKTLLEALRANKAAQALRLAFDQEGKISVIGADQPQQPGEVTVPVARHYLFDMDFASREQLPVNFRGAVEEFNDARKHVFKSPDTIRILFVGPDEGPSQFLLNRYSKDGYHVVAETADKLKEKLAATVSSVDVIVMSFDKVSEFPAQMEILQPMINIFKQTKGVVVVVRPEDEQVLGEEARKKYLSEESVLMRAVSPEEAAAKLRMIVDELAYPSPFSSPAEESMETAQSSPAGGNKKNGVAARLLQEPTIKRIEKIIQEKALPGGLDKNIIVLEIRESDIGTDGRIKEDVIKAIQAQRNGAPGATIVVLQKRLSPRVGMDDRLNKIPVQGYFQYEGDIVTKKDLPELIVGALSGRNGTNGKGIWYFPPEQNETPLMKALARSSSPASNEVGEASPQAGSPSGKTDQPRQALANDAKAGHVKIIEKRDMGLGSQQKRAYILEDSEGHRFVLIGLQDAPVLPPGSSWTLYHARPGSLGVEGPWVLFDDDSNVDLDGETINQILSKIPEERNTGSDRVISDRSERDLGVINLILNKMGSEQFFLNTIAGLGEEISETEWQRMVSWTNKDGAVFANVADPRQTTWGLKIEAGTDEQGPTLTYTLTVLININPEVPREKDGAWVLTIPGTRAPADQKISPEEFKKILAQMEAEATYVPPVSSPVSSSTVDGNDIGGINLDPSLLNLQIKRDKNWVPLPIEQQPPVEQMNIEGFYPVIINVTPLPGLPILLGLESGNESAPDSAGKYNAAPVAHEKLSLRELSPAEHKARTRQA